MKWAHQQNAACPLQLLHGCVKVGFGHVRKLIHPTVNQEALEASHSSLDHGPDLELHRHKLLVEENTAHNKFKKCSTWLPGITPPQKAVSTKHFPVDSRSFS